MSNIFARILRNLPVSNVNSLGVYNCYQRTRTELLEIFDQGRNCGIFIATPYVFVYFVGSGKYNINLVVFLRREFRFRKCCAQAVFVYRLQKNSVERSELPGNLRNLGFAPGTIKLVIWFVRVFCRRYNSFNDRNSLAIQVSENTRIYIHFKSNRCDVRTKIRFFVSNPSQSDVSSVAREVPNCYFELF